MLETIRNWEKDIEKYWWGLVIVYLSILGVIYGATWTVMESSDIPAIISPAPVIATRRYFYLIAIVLILSAHITLVIAVIFRKLNVRQKLMGKKMEVLEQQQEAYEDILMKYVLTHDVKEATFIHFSSGLTRNFIMKLIERGVKITFYMHNPNSTMLQKTEYLRTVMEKNREEIEGLEKYYIDRIGHKNKIEIRYYDVPTTIRGCRLDDSILAIGWYIWEYRFSIDQEISSDAKKRIEAYKFEKVDKSSIEYWGHNRPGLIVYNGSPVYKFLSDMFSRQIANFEIYHDIRDKWKEVDKVG